VPPLRDRRDDIPVLATRFLQTVAAVYRREPLSLTDEAQRWLQGQAWPGNVRQLRQAIERAVLVSRGDRLTIDDFSASVAMDTREPASDMLPPVGAMTMDEIERAMIQKALKHHGRNLSRVADALGLSRAALYRRLEKYEIQV
jgi:DNA-binding NtrC family response regulator